MQKTSSRLCPAAFLRNVSRETGLKAKNAKSVDQTLSRHRPAAILEKPGKGIGRAEKGNQREGKIAITH